MRNIIKLIKEYLHQKEEKKELALLHWSCDKLAISISDLILVTDEECEQIINQLEQQIAKEIGDEPYTVSGADLPGSNIPADYVIPQAYTWRDIIRCLKQRTKQVYRIKTETSMGDVLLFYYCSSAETWKQLCGRAGYMLISTNPLAEIGFACHRMN